ncbi:YhgE/Pip family protein [Puerhibacterium sp. TATVAM-FAB25]|uniref:YhgE/Pip family protein n=1 Tax=Puerhibacterium sp. TATVAM-FAB25 TaxID=3093699 RepID=UPI00397B770C
MTRRNPWSVVAVALLPVLALALLLAALWNPQERLDTVRAAIVNLDEPVEVGGQTVPLGRQLVAGLVSGQAPSTDPTARAVPASDEGYDWQITDADDAAAGLEDGTYAAVITIPENFSAAATSVGGDDPSAAQQATIDVATPPGGRVVDEALAGIVATTATDVMSSSITETYVDNVLVGFTTLHDQLGQASDGATQLADGAGSAASGADQLADGAGQLADGAAASAAGAGELADGAGQLASGAAAAATGAGRLADGAGQLAAGIGQSADAARGLAEGAGEVAVGARGVADGVAGLNQGLQQLDQALPQVPALPETGALLEQLAPALQRALTTLGEACADGDEVACAVAEQLAGQVDVGGLEAGLGQLDRALDQAGQLRSAVGDLAGAAAEIAPAAEQVAAGTEGLATGSGELAAGLDQLETAAGQVAGGAGDLRSGVGQLASGAGGLQGGASALSSGVGQLASGADGLQGGASALSSGVGQLASGADGLQTGAADLSSGVGQLRGGADELAGGLSQAVDQVPSYDDGERASLASVVADPVRSPAPTSLGSGSTGPLFAVVALWLGALALTLVYPPVAPGALGSTRSSLRLAVRSVLAPAAVGAATGAVVGGILAGVQGLSAGGWVGTILVGALVSVCFVAVNQGLVGLLGDVGRAASILVAVLAIATGVVATVPAILVTITDVLPVGAAQDALAGLVIPEVGGTGGAVAALVGWTLLGVALTVAATARRRRVRAAELVAA